MDETTARIHVLDDRRFGEWALQPAFWLFHPKWLK
jgi:hypothetical protein